MCGTSGRWVNRGRLLAENILEVLMEISKRTISKFIYWINLKFWTEQDSDSANFFKMIGQITNKIWASRISICASHNHFIFIMEISIPVKTVFILRQGSDLNTTAVITVLYAIWCSLMSLQSLCYTIYCLRAIVTPTNNQTIHDYMRQMSPHYVINYTPDHQQINSLAAEEVIIEKIIFMYIFLTYTFQRNK